MSIAIPEQQLQIKKSAYKGKQVGLLVTTLVGALGSLATAIVASNQTTDSNGTVNTKPATITGASVAGATALAGVVSLFFVKSDSDEQIQQLKDYQKQIADAVKAYDDACGTIPEEKAQSWLKQGRLLANKCLQIAAVLPIAVPNVSPPKGRKGE